ncbi:MAG: hypothetical protein HQL37_14680, partial [Alphaproteobacteria bacterium]|nr:hypothetical protein [Alphaproteobacteria bacterium]
MKANQYLRTYYTDLVRSYVLHQEERFLAMAADLGRSALRREIPLEEIADMHDGVLLALAERNPRLTLANAVRLASPPFMEMLMAYGMAFREQLDQRQAVEAQLLEARDAAELASHAKSDFLASMSHERRTPLNAVIGFADMLEAEIFGPLGDKHYKDYAASIGEAGRHLLNLITNILEASQIGSGELLLDIEEIDIGELASGCVRMMRGKAETNGLEIIVKISPSLPNVRVDRRRFKQILFNLLSNALKFTPPGGQVTVSIKENKSDELVLTVA